MIIITDNISGSKIRVFFSFDWNLSGGKRKVNKFSNKSLSVLYCCILCFLMACVLLPRDSALAETAGTSSASAGNVSAVSAEPVHFGSFCGKDFYAVTTVTDAYGSREKGMTISGSGKEWSLWQNGGRTLVVSYDGKRSEIDFSDLESATGVSGLSGAGSDSGMIYVLQYSGVVTRQVYLKTSSGRYIPCYSDQTGGVQAKMYFHPTGRGVSDEYLSDYYEIATIYDGQVNCSGLSDEEILRLAYVQSNHRGDTGFLFLSKNVRETWVNNRR
jgi:hypothetical protein